MRKLISFKLFENSESFKEAYQTYFIKTIN